jgi:hypothetical protein
MLFLLDYEQLSPKLIAYEYLNRRQNKINKNTAVDIPGSGNCEITQ